MSASHKIACPELRFNVKTSAFMKSQSVNLPGEQHFCVFCKTLVVDKVHGMMWGFFSLNTGIHVKFLLGLRSKKGFCLQMNL